jgi:hypothetical protein
MIGTMKMVEFPAELISAAVEVNRADKAYFEQWCRFWATVKPIGKSRFWELLKLFRNEIEVYCFNYKRTNGVEDAAWEFFRKVLTGQASYSAQEAYGFVKAYEKIKSLLDKKHAALSDYCGDGFGDLMDSLPLAGEEFFGRRFTTESDLNCAVNELGVNWSNFIHGENYVEMMLEDAAKKYTLVVARQPSEE